MGCTCGKEGGSNTSNAEHRPSQGFLVTQDKEEFLKTITPEERSDKKRLLWFWHLLQEGSFDIEFAEHRNRIVSRAIKEGVPPRFRWQFFRSATDYKNGYRSGEFQKYVEVGEQVVSRAKPGQPSQPIRLVSTDTGSLSPAPRFHTTVAKSPAYIKSRTNSGGSLSEGGIPAPNQADSTPRATGSSVPVTPIRRDFSAEHSYVRDVIRKDLRRTFPDNAFFNKDGQGKLNRILLAYAGLHREVGYCQGMNFIAGFLLAISASDDQTEEEPFWMFVQIMNSYGACCLFADSTPLLHLLMFQYNNFFEKQLPDVHKHMTNLNFLTEMYLPQWILTLFCKEFPFATVQRIWEFMLCRGLRSIIEVCLAIMHLLREDIVKQHSMEEMKIFLRKAPIELDGNKIVRSADSISNKYKEKGWKEKDDPYENYEKQWAEQNDAESKRLAAAMASVHKLTNKKEFIGGLCSSIELIESESGEQQQEENNSEEVEDAHDEREPSPLTEAALATLDIDPTSSKSKLTLPILKVAQRRSQSLDPPKRVISATGISPMVVRQLSDREMSPRSAQLSSARDSGMVDSLADVIPSKMSKESTSAEGHEIDDDVGGEEFRLPPPPLKDRQIEERCQETPPTEPGTAAESHPMPF